MLVMLSAVRRTRSRWLGAPSVRIIAERKPAVVLAQFKQRQASAVQLYARQRIDVVGARAAFETLALWLVLWRRNNELDIAWRQVETMKFAGDGVACQRKVEFRSDITRDL